jgi:hypothetical protein
VRRQGDPPGGPDAWQPLKDFVHVIVSARAAGLAIARRYGDFKLSMNLRIWCRTSDSFEMNM